MRLFDFEAEPSFKLRNYQLEWYNKVQADRASGLTRLLIDASGGLGKSTFFAYLAKQEWEQHGKRTLVLANRDRLVRQSAKRMAEETGLEVEIEMAENHASPFAQIVMGSAPTLGRINRLTGFDPAHFSIVVPDEAHHSMADQFQRILRYFHYGAESLNESWVLPEDGSYEPKAHIIGTTATPPAPGKKNHLGQFFQKISARYSYISAVDDGWLVPPKMTTVPVKIDLSRFKLGRTSHGADFKPEDLSAAMIPIIEELAKQIVAHASDRKTMCFLPSVQCARLMAAALERLGLVSIFVSGECIDADDKATRFDEAPMGTVMCLCSIYVEGIDFISVSCIAWFRATVSEEWYKQGVFRGTRTLKGVVNDDMTADERKAAIAVSAKPDMLILDPLYNSDRLDLCSVHDLFTDNPEVKKAMQELDGMELLEAAKKAERDFLKSLEKAAKKAEAKAARINFDPLAWSVALSDEKLASYVPVEPWQREPIRAEQARLLVGLNMDPVKYGIKTAGLAQEVTKILLHRKEFKLASPAQLEFINSLTKEDKVTGERTPMFSGEYVARMKGDQAGAIMGRMKAKWRAR